MFLRVILGAAGLSIILVSFFGSSYQVPNSLSTFQDMFWFTLVFVVWVFGVLGLISLRFFHDRKARRTAVCSSLLLGVLVGCAHGLSRQHAHGILPEVLIECWFFASAFALIATAFFVNRLPAAKQ
jgi:predicted membrane channel-forming protein YqfA (hemolysin III family)